MLGISACAAQADPPAESAPQEKNAAAFFATIQCATGGLDECLSLMITTAYIVSQSIESAATAHDEKPTFQVTATKDQLFDLAAAGFRVVAAGIAIVTLPKDTTDEEKKVADDVAEGIERSATVKAAQELGKISEATLDHICKIMRTLVETIGAENEGSISVGRTTRAANHYLQQRLHHLNLDMRPCLPWEPGARVPLDPQDDDRRR